ncbi:hypothetical protein [Haloferula rosea]|uniref:Uncharacterized protein n=1 Tax=Haloferula rosea TaxID=490093 RepID=A0A934RFH0_9BACT|nr:hypothetical protein [Haloferula rosea]MBK1828219.1 hypothetical protein [Haloferula rosea]
MRTLMDIIQFHCPACRTLLRVPPAAAGFQGPCPACQREIVGPVPAKGLEARLAPEDAFTPFPGSPIPAPPSEPEPTPPASEPTPEPEPELHQPPQPQPQSEPGPELPRKDDTPPFPTAEEPEPFRPFSDTPDDLAPPENSSEPITSEPALPQSDSGEPASPQVPTECLAPKSVRRLRAAVLILSCLLCSVISYVFGYVMAQKSRSFAPPIFADPAAILDSPGVPEERTETPPPDLPELPDDTPSEADLDADPPEIDLSGTPESTSPAPAARATLDAFLSAPDWASRSAYVLAADEVRADMKAHAEEFGDGPIDTTGIEPAYAFPDQEHFIVRTETIPTGFPVTLQKIGTDWRVDWQVFHEFHGDLFRRFASGKLGATGEFHLYLRPHAKQDANGFTRYQLTAPIEGRSYPAFGKRGSMAQAKITALLDSEEFRSNPDIQELLDKDGVPLVLKLSYQSRGQDQNFLLIEDLVAQGWGR